ncbi:phosphoenolpyruvate--protein phosphotransferase [Rhodobacteraceae bacterium NNCM2]|nr:phosphoenolpyruvate--protein phosphotransferase [Coraliihabitans acroporae]
MPANSGGSRALLRTLRAVLAGAGDGQQRLDQVVKLVAGNMVAEVCSIYLKRDERTLELCATEGLNPNSVHSARLRVGQGLVGRIAEKAEPISTDKAQSEPGFRYLPETGEEIYQSFVGVPIQRLGEVMGVIVVQNRTARVYTDDEVEALEIVAMVIAEMAEAGAFLGSDGLLAGPGRRVGPIMVSATTVSEGLAAGPIHLHEPRLVVFDPIAEDIPTEHKRLEAALDALRQDIDTLAKDDLLTADSENRDIIDSYRMFAHDKGWNRRLREAIDGGLAAEVAVEKVQSAARARMERATDAYLRERLHDLDDLANRLLRKLTNGDGQDEMPEGAILVARNIGPGELLERSKHISGLILEEGSLSSHAAIIARSMALPMVIQAERITRDVNQGDHAVLDATEGRVHLRPEASVQTAFTEKLALEEQAREIYRTLSAKPAITLDGQRLSLKMNAGVLADLPSLVASGAEGVGLFRTELQFMIRQSLPGREQQAALYSRVLDAADGREIVFRTLDIGSDKILPYMAREEEPNPALGWRAIRVGLDRPRLFRMQMQSLIRGANGRPLSIMFPMVADEREFFEARGMFLGEVERLTRLGHTPPGKLSIGCMLETPSLAFAADRLYQTADFISVGGNDLMQFFFAADRENERVRRRYDALSYSFLGLLEHIAQRCAEHGTRLSFCGESAGRPVDALALAAIGFRELSMRPVSIGPVKQALRQTDLGQIATLMAADRKSGSFSARSALEAWLSQQGIGA